MLEGLSRELIRAVQVIRKQSGYLIEQRICLEIDSNDETINKVLNKYKDKIVSEALVKEFGKVENPDFTNEITVGGETVTVKVKA